MIESYQWLLLLLLLSFIFLWILLEIYYDYTGCIALNNYKYIEIALLNVYRVLFQIEFKNLHYQSQ
jgi:hypothetical protein